MLRDRAAAAGGPTTYVAAWHLTHAQETRP